MIGDLRPLSLISEFQPEDAQLAAPTTAQTSSLLITVSMGGPRSETGRTYWLTRQCPFTGELLSRTSDSIFEWEREGK